VKENIGDAELSKVAKANVCPTLPSVYMGRVTIEVSKDLNEVLSNPSCCFIKNILHSVSMLLLKIA
jgi:hypothetical protein